MNIEHRIELLIDTHLKAGSEASRPASEILVSILGKGVSPNSLAHRLAIEIEDSGRYSNRKERILAFADLLSITVKALRIEGEAR